MKPYLLESSKVLEEQHSDEGRGLAAIEASNRLAQYGPNKLDEGEKTPLWKRFFAQMADPMIIMLIVAAVVSAVVGIYEGGSEGFADVGIIMFVVILNSVLGVVQESKAEEALGALQEMAAAQSKVVRDGRIVTVPSSELVVGDVVVLVVPVDSAAPKGRLILPQQQTLRDILDAHATAVVAQVPQLAGTLASLRTPPRLVITDSQAFAEVRAIVPREVPLTSFSILFARYKGDYAALSAGAAAVDALPEGARILVSEGCTHRRQCGDIGTQKIPRWLEAYAKRSFVFETTSGRGWPVTPEALRRYALVVHCGGCMLPRREMRRRIADCAAAGVPIVNYGVLIAKLRGVPVTEEL